MPWTRAASLRARLLILVALAVIPALGVILYSGLQQRDEVADDARREAMGTARSVAADQQRLVRDARQFLSLLAQLEPIHSGSAQACGALLSDLLTEREQYANLGLIRADGTVICSAIPLQGPMDLSDRSYFRRAVATRDFAVGDYQVGRITGEASINFAHPVLDDQSQVRAVVYAALPLGWLSRRLAEAQLPPGSVITVVDPGFTVLARYPEPGDWVGRNIRGSHLAAAIDEAEGEGTAETTGPDDVERLYAVHPLQEQEGGESVYVIVGIPSRVAFAAVDRALLRNLIGLSVLALLALAAAWWGSEVFILRPVRALLGATRRLASGDLSSRAPASDDRDELSELGHAFNDMAAALERHETQIQTHLGRIARLNRMYAVLSGINSAILRIRTEDELLREVCRIAVKHGQLRLAMVHRVDPAGEDVRLAAWSGAAPGDQEDPPMPEGGDDGAGLVETVIREDRVMVVGDAAADPRLASWSGPIRARGYASAAALPLRMDGTVVAVLTLFASEPEFFDEEELRLLRELAADASLGLQYIENERRMEYLSNYDALTGLPNRTLFADRLQQAIAAARQDQCTVGVLAVKIDRVAEINATLGHHAGDAVLREVAGYLAGAVREGDTVARVGSGEFGVILADVRESGRVATLANEILTHAPAMVQVDQEPVFVSLSIGGSIYPLDGEQVPALMQSATLARRATGSEVANTLSFYRADIDAQAQEKRQIEHELRGATDRDELMLYYQPVVDVRSRTIIGVEALLRWDSPQLGFVSPGKFIPVAEETGLITSIGEWIVATACRQGQEWHGRGHELRVNVNVSVDQLRAGDFVERMTHILGRAGFDPRFLSLGLEITESELMENVQAAVDIMGHFRDMGMAVYIDDFGTGYSSLAYLRQLPIDTLKIDTSFIRDIPGDADAVAVVKSIIAMAHSLELRVVAEGVEKEEQFAVLEELGCDAIQGYLFGRPSPPDQVEPLFGKPL